MKCASAAVLSPSSGRIPSRKAASREPWPRKTARIPSKRPASASPPAYRWRKPEQFRRMRAGGDAAKSRAGWGKGARAARTLDMIWRTPPKASEAATSPATSKSAGAGCSSATASGSGSMCSRRLKRAYSVSSRWWSAQWGWRLCWRISGTPNQLRGLLSGTGVLDCQNKHDTMCFASRDAGLD